MFNARNLFFCFSIFLIFFFPNQTKKNQWLAKTNSCPLCRFELPTNNAMYEAKKREKNNVNSSENDGDFLLSSRHASQTQFI